MKMMRTTKSPELALFLGLCLAFGCGGGDDTNDDGASADDDESGDDDDDDDDDDDSMTDPSADDDDDGSSTSSDDSETSASTVDTSDSGDTTTNVDDSTGDSSDDGSESSTGEQIGNTIYEIQDGTLDEGAAVEVYGVIVTGIGLTGIFVQEPAGGEYSGAFVFSGMGGPDWSDAQVGDSIDISGVTSEYFDFTQIVITDGTYVNNGADTPLEPELVDIATVGDPVEGEPWESVLVRIEGSITVSGISMFDELTVADRGDAVLVDNFCYEIVNGGEFDGVGVGSEFSAIQGPVNFFFDDFRISPRSADDLEGFTP
jgi:predicted extracellular nuclease